MCSMDSCQATALVVSCVTSPLMRLSIIILQNELNVTFQFFLRQYILSKMEELNHAKPSNKDQY